MEKIMILNSNALDLQNLNDDLSKDYIVLACNRATKALDLLSVFKPAALVLDPSALGLSTREFVQKARALPQMTGLPVLAVTRVTTLRNIEESFDWGVDVIFSKPVPTDRLRKRLETSLIRNRLLGQRGPTLALPTGPNSLV